MIKRITNPEEFKKAADDIFELFDEENKNAHPSSLRMDKESIKNAFSDRGLLAWDVFVWANLNNGKYDAACIFINDNNVKLGVKIFSEFVWLSKNPKVGFKILQEAVSFARENDFDYISICSMSSNPQKNKYERLYKKLGFLEDSKIFISKL